VGWKRTWNMGWPWLWCWVGGHHHFALLSLFHRRIFSSRGTRRRNSTCKNDIVFDWVGHSSIWTLKFWYLAIRSLFKEISSFFFNFCPWINCNCTLAFQHYLQNSPWFLILFLIDSLTFNSFKITPEKNQLNYLLYPYIFTLVLGL
jgi:hypothetical protein